MVGARECGNESSVFIKWGEFLGTAEDLFLS